MIRSAEPYDEAAVAAVATAHDLAGYDSVHNPRYQALLRDHGRLVVAEHRGEVVGFGGMILTGGVAMITDLFVLEDAHGLGLGTGMTDALLDGFERRMTFSSRHPAARATYARAGMEPQWFLRYMRGAVSSVDVEPRDIEPQDGGSLRAVDVGQSDVKTDRPELVEFFSGARFLQLVDDGGGLRGHAIVRDTGTYLAVDRLVTDAPHDAAVIAVVGALPVGAIVEACVPEPSPAYSAMIEIGFAEVEYDLHMASEPGLMPRGAVALNPGLA